MALSSASPEMATGSERKLLELHQIAFAYPEGPPVLSTVSLSLGAGEVLGLSGANGSGKTTLFRCVTGLEKPQGEIFFLGKKIAAERDFLFLRQHVGFVLQNPDNQIVFPTVLEDVMFGPLNLGLSQKEAHDRAHHWLAKLGIEKYAPRIVSNLSGGEKKLTALAGILAMEPDLLLLDEPLNELDANARLRLLDALRENVAAKIIASHDNCIFRELGCQVARLEAGILSHFPAGTGF